MKVVSIVGGRPQFIKAAVVSRALGSLPQIDEALLHTGQHYDHNMSKVFFSELGIAEPARNLGIGSGPHGAQTGRMIEAIETALFELKPDLALVFGDTNSTLAGALAAVKLHIPVAHVEAGLRSGNRRMPEEINRVLTDHASDLLFAPTATAAHQLGREGIPADRIHQVGDVMYDAALFYEAKAESASDILRRLDLLPKAYVLATVHRAENTDDPIVLEAIFTGLSDLAAGERIPIVLPLHPRTKACLARASLTAAKLSPWLRLIEPVGYLDMVMLTKNARMIATDSGGVQKEAFFYQVPCVTLRHETEWVELIELGWNTLAPPRSAAEVTTSLLAALTAKDGRPANVYGDGRSGEKIARLISQHHFERP